MWIRAFQNPYKHRTVQCDTGKLLGQNSCHDRDYNPRYRCSLSPEVRAPYVDRGSTMTDHVCFECEILELISVT
jgi:hypothetical protein